MKRWIVIVVGLATAALGGAALWNICSHRVVKSQLSEVYNRYKDRSDLRVAFVKEYRVDDSTFVDVTTLTAKDSASWEALQREMNRSEDAIEHSRNRIKEGHYILTDYYCEIGHPEHRIAYKEGECCLVYINHKEKTIYIFHISNNEQGRTIVRNKVSEAKKNAKKY